MPTRTTHRVATLDDADPLTLAIAPPPDETPEERAVRVRAEQHSKAVSDSIDQELEAQRQEAKRGIKPIKILLSERIGQIHDTQKKLMKADFQLLYEPKAFTRERAGWRGVIFLNICRSIHVILDAMAYVQTHTTRATSPGRASSPPNGPLTPPMTPTVYPELDPELLRLKARLQPVLGVEELLIRRLTEDSGETEATQLDTINRSRSVLKEVAVNASLQWKGAFAKHHLRSDQESIDSSTAVDWDDPDDPGIVLNECSEDIKKLWRHPTIQEMLNKQNLRLEEMAGFFLDALDEVTSPRYLPSDEHILRARLKTLGVTEHRFKLNGGTGVGSDWRIFDVGGHRSLVHAWAPYFDDMNAILFLAPISAFDQVLSEAPKINRLEDSVHLWQTIVSNRLLQNTTIILFLNKIDLMQQKLASGIRLRDYVVSYGDRPNDYESAAAYLKKKFAAIMREQSPVPRTFYCHLTNVTDMKATKYILGSIRDSIMQTQLRDAQLLA